MKIITFITTETDGLHQDKFYDQVIKKNLYKYAHLLKLTYHQCSYDNKTKKLTLVNKSSMLVKPEHFFVSPEILKINQLDEKKLNKANKLVDVLEKFKNDLKKSSIIVGHNLNFHLKTILASCFREAVEINLRNYLLIDLIDYNHPLEYPSLKKLAEYCLGDKYEEKDRKYNIELIKEIFLVLYNKL
jgi:DNA polymerase III epsilon subunit-like protein